jgi:anti-sigma B factor antagonist
LGQVVGLSRVLGQAEIMNFHQVYGGPDGARVVLSGDIDLVVRADLRRVLAGVVGVSPGAVDLDLYDVTFLDCSGIGEFVRAHVDTRSRGHPLTVSRPRGVARRLLELTGVLAVLMPDDAAGGSVSAVRTRARYGQRETEL